MIGGTASALSDVDDAAESPLGRCESGTLIGLCLRMAFFFCALPIGIMYGGLEEKIEKSHALGVNDGPGSYSFHYSYDYTMRN